VLSRATLEKMWTPQFTRAGEKTGAGIGFRLGQLESRRVVAHGGAACGFATELAALPDERLGVAVATNMDGANAVTGRIAHEALRLMLAARSGRRLPSIPKTSPLAPEYPPKLAGRYGTGDRAVDLIARGGELYAQFVIGGYRVRMRRLENGLISDDRLSFGNEIDPFGDHVRVAGQDQRRLRLPRPSPAPARWKGLIGEYGPDYDTLYILEKDGKLHALVGWFEYDPLTPVSDTVFRFPDHGLYDHETLTFTRGGDGRASAVRMGAVKLDRRSVGPEDGKSFRIQPVRPVEELRREALAASPPKETGDFRAPELVELTKLDPKIRLDVRYAKKNNFLGTPLYSRERAFLQKPAAEALVRAQRRLARMGYGLLVHDAYRPWYVTKMFWDATPEKDHIFVANPATGSRHNRGCAVDLTLYDLKTGTVAEMPGTYDEMSPRSYADYPGGTSLQRGLRDLLRWGMESEGFTVYQYEWWHFDYRDWGKYPILNVRFEEIGKAAPSS
jgi:D-alanyl-D-alanine dipeptidase